MNHDFGQEPFVPPLQFPDSLYESHGYIGRSSMMRFDKKLKKPEYRKYRIMLEECEKRQPRPKNTAFLDWLKSNALDIIAIIIAIIGLFFNL